jgi:MoaA/NifB/PqqE/SkfB family radical SAM enzyme
MRRIPYQFLFRYATNVMRARYRRGPNRKLLPPLMATLYVTTKCNFRCTYCDDGSGNMYPHLAERRLDTRNTLEVLKLLRRVSPGLNITGGEPTLRHDIEEILDHANLLDFAPVTLNTNGFLLDRHLHLLKYVDYVIVSLDSTDAQRGDALIHLAKTGQTERVKRNLEIVREYRREHKLKFDVVINTVILPETIGDAWDVFEYCLRRDFYWTPMPYVAAKYAAPGLIDNPEWRELIDEVIRAKRAGARICGNVEALRTIRDFKRFECYPTTHPAITPSGDVHYPCSPLNKVAGNLVEIGDYDEVMRRGAELHGPIPECDARCHVACHTETSTAITHPQEGLAELAHFIFQRRNKSFNLRRPPLVRPEKLPTAAEIRALPSLPPDVVRRLRKAGAIEHDFTSRVDIVNPAIASKRFA